MKRIKILSVLLAILVTVPILGFTGSGEKGHEEITGQVIQLVEKEYGVFYEIPFLEATVVDVADRKDHTTYTIDVVFTRVLLAESASELPYIAGMENQLSKTYSAYAQEQLDRKKNELNDLYIGQEQTTSITFLVVAPNTKMSGAPAIYAYDPISESAHSYQEAMPNRAEDSFAAGQNAVKTMEEFSRASTVAAQNPDAKNYDRVDARDYARRHALDYNTDEYVTQTQDCANFVSQCIKAGGLSTDSVWYPYSGAWNTVTSGNPGLPAYMVNQEYFFSSTNVYQAFAGSIVRWTTGAHVGIIDQNDTNTITFCAHNSDQLSTPLSSGLQSQVDYRVPEWDSVAGAWTR